MQQVAIFVDAGYLYVEGARLLTGTYHQRRNISVILPGISDHLAQYAKTVAPEARLLRIYWYDGLRRGGRPNDDQLLIANAGNMKLRLGHINVKGQQKGVDTLIVLDLTELSRNKSISDAVVISGDEDVRTGVSVAQSLGVRVHLLGVKSNEGSQSNDLIQEADTHHVWTEEVISCVIKVDDDQDEVGDSREPAAQNVCLSVSVPHLEQETNVRDLIERAVKETLEELPEASMVDLVNDFRGSSGTVPKAVHAPALKRLATLLGRTVAAEEKTTFNNYFRRTLERLSTDQSD